MKGSLLPLKDLCAFDNHIRQGTVILVRLHERDLLNHIKSLNHLAKDRNRTIQMGHTSYGLVNQCYTEIVGVAYLNGTSKIEPRDGDIYELSWRRDMSVAVAHEPQTI